ncbi:MAG: cell division protein ZapB [Desulfobacteraceae bacterium]|nr:MAG: cell division protein ZapB [Desulfobacteraceae bacterium]
MFQQGEVDQFELLEEKIESLIRYVGTIRKEKEELAEKTRSQEEKISALTSEVERLRQSKEKAKQRIVSLLEKMEPLGV